MWHGVRPGSRAAALLLLLSPATQALYEDQVGKVDWCVHEAAAPRHANALLAARSPRSHAAGRT